MAIDQADVQHVFLIGAKSIGAYGGYETFVHKLLEYHQKQKKIKYHVACKANGSGCMDETKLNNVVQLSEDEFEYYNAHCVKIKIPNIGAAQAIYYDIKAVCKFIEYVKYNNISNPIFYIMACRIGPFAEMLYRRIHKLGGRLYVNPDGHEWMRAKWSIPVQKYWKYSEKKMIKYCDLAICDSKNIETYIHNSYDRKGINHKDPNTVYIAYGAEIGTQKKIDDSILVSWYKEHRLSEGNYYLVVGRFVPENNYEIMIREFMQCKTDKDFAIITNVNEDFLNKLEERLNFRKDKRIKFVGTVYNQELLMKIRENAYGYFHGHEVGGTNPSLLEALGSTNVNLLLDVGFNREVAENSAIYWNKETGNLTELIERVDSMSIEEREKLGKMAKERIAEAYSWEFISSEYERVFLQNKL